MDKNLSLHNKNPSGEVSQGFLKKLSELTQEAVKNDKGSQICFKLPAASESRTGKCNKEKIDNIEIFKCLAELIEAEESDTILNIGCGCGKLAGVLRERGLNVTVVSDGWKDSLINYDIIVATHFHSLSDIKHICRMTKKRAYVLTPTDVTKSFSGNSHKEGTHIYENMSDIFNMLYLYGINPNVKIVRVECEENTSKEFSLIWWDAQT